MMTNSLLEQYNQFMKKIQTTILYITQVKNQIFSKFEVKLQLV